jgi:hypothetical protein
VEDVAAVLLDGRVQARVEVRVGAAEAARKRRRLRGWVPALLVEEAQDLRRTGRSRVDEVRPLDLAAVHEQELHARKRAVPRGVPEERRRRRVVEQPRLDHRTRRRSADERLEVVDRVRRQRNSERVRVLLPRPRSDVEAPRAVADPQRPNKLSEKAGAALLREEGVHEVGVRGLELRQEPEEEALEKGAVVLAQARVVVDARRLRMHRHRRQEAALRNEGAADQPALVQRKDKRAVVRTATAEDPWAQIAVK